MAVSVFIIGTVFFIKITHGMNVATTYLTVSSVAFLTVEIKKKWL